MLTFIWQFSNLLVQQQQGDVPNAMVSVKYRLCATDRYRSVYRYGSVDFAPADPDVFTPYEDVTEETMISFAEQTLGDQLDIIKAEMIDEHGAPPVEERELPWEMKNNALTRL